MERALQLSHSELVASFHLDFKQSLFTFRSSLRASGRGRDWREETTLRHLGKHCERRQPYG